jgi:GNAT superfamily N-acetyltransferase
MLTPAGPAPRPATGRRLRHLALAVGQRSGGGSNTCSGGGDSGSEIEVQTVAVVDWAKGLITQQDRDDLVRCQQVGTMAFHTNPKRTKPTLEFEPWVAQYEFDPARDEVPEPMSSNAIDRTFESWRQPPEWGDGSPPLGRAGQRNHRWHIGRVGGAVVATAKTCEVTVTHTDTGEEEVMLALTGVAVDPRGSQGKGYGAAVVSAALKRSDDTGLTLLFQTGDALGLYEKLGCVKVDHALAIDSTAGNPSKKRPFADYHMVVYPPSAVPSAPIELHGSGW